MDQQFHIKTLKKIPDPQAIDSHGNSIREFELVKKYFMYRLFIIEVQAIYYRSTGHFLLKYRPFILKYRPFFIEVKAIHYRSTCLFLLKYRPFFIEVQAIYYRSTCHFLLRYIPFFYWITWKKLFGFLLFTEFNFF